MVYFDLPVIPVIIILPAVVGLAVVGATVGAAPVGAAVEFNQYNMYINVYILVIRVE